MIEVLLSLLATTEQDTEAIRIARGKNKLPENRQELLNKFKDIWRSRK